MSRAVIATVVALFAVVPTGPASGQSSSGSGFSGPPRIFITIPNTSPKPKLGAGTKIDIQGAGKRFDGKYSIPGTTHTYGKKPTGLQTRARPVDR